MTDRSVVEQAEREIARNILKERLRWRRRLGLDSEESVIDAMMEFSKRDRCSLLALRKAARVGFLPLGVLVKSGEVELNDWLSPELKVAIREGEEALRGALEGER